MSVRFELRRSAFHPEGHLTKVDRVVSLEEAQQACKGHNAAHTAERQKFLADLKVGGECPVNREYYARRIS